MKKLIAVLLVLLVASASFTFACEHTEDGTTCKWCSAKSCSASTMVIGATFGGLAGGAAGAAAAGAATAGAAAPVGAVAGGAAGAVAGGAAGAVAGFFDGLNGECGEP